MNQQQVRTVHLNQRDEETSTRRGADEVVIAAIGRLERTAPGRSVRDTLEAAGITLPEAHQILRVNTIEEENWGRVLQPGDRLTIVNKVAGG